MKSHIDYLLVLFFFLLNFYMSEGTSIIPCDHKDDYSSAGSQIIPFPLHTDFLSVIQHKSEIKDTMNLDDLPPEILTYILHDVANIDLRAVSKIFYELVTGELFIEPVTGMNVCSKYRGIQPTINLCYDFKNSKLESQSRTVSLDISNVPTWIWQGWITKVVNIPVEYIFYLQGTNIKIFCLKNEKSRIINIDNIITIKNTFYSHFSEVFKALKKINIQTIVLRNFYFDEKMAVNFAQSLKDINVTCIDLDGNDMGEVAVAFANALDKDKFYTITLNNNNLGDQAVNFIQALQGKNVQEVDLSYNGIRDDIIALAEALKKTNIVCLHLQLNRIKELALPFTRLLKESALKKVNLGCNGIETQMKQDILALQLPIEFIF